MAQRRKKTWGDTYTAQVVVNYTPLGPVNHLKVCRHDGKTNRLTWDELMVIKNEMLGEDACAIELFPRVCAVVNEVNIRHLWELPEGVLLEGFGLKKRDG
jgi:hypothetical protein